MVLHTIRIFSSEETTSEEEKLEDGFVVRAVQYPVYPSVKMATVRVLISGSVREEDPFW